MFTIADAVVLVLWPCPQSASVLGQCFGDCRKSTKAWMRTHVGDELVAGPASVSAVGFRLVF